MRARYTPHSSQPFPMRLAITGIAIMVLVAISSAVATWDVGTRIRTITASQIAVITATERLQRHGEALESSAKLAVATGSPAYVERYRLIQPQLRQAMQQLRASIRLRENARFAQQVDRADLEATIIEKRALDLVLSGRRTEAGQLLEGAEYRGWVEIYYKGLESIERRSQVFLTENQQQLHRILLGDVLLSLGGLPLAALAWFFLVRPARRWGKELDEARQQAEIAAVTKSEFLATMSHEIRTPLNSIIGFTDLLLEDERLNESQRRQISLVHSSGQALLTVVNDVLDISRIEAGRIDLHEEPFAIEALIDNTVSITRSGAEAKGLSLNVVRDPKLAKFYLGDEHRLRQVLLNLINNGVKFTPSGSVSVTASLQQRDAAKDLLRFAITDTGEGIAEENQHRLFQDFSQADASVTRRHGGTGLGLAISKRLVEAMGGSIGVVSDQGKGSTFWFEITLSQSETPRVKEREAQQSTRAAKILLVEDVPVNQELACAILRRDGHEVDTADNGEEAVEAVKANAYDLVLMDIQMPKMDGITATRIIRELPSPQGKVPIIATTANVLPGQVKQCLQAGMDGHVGKPINQLELKTAIHKIMQSHRVEQPGAESAHEEVAFDPQVYENVQTLLPPQRLRSHLARFDAELGAVFGDGTAAEGLEQAAHKIVSQAGMLGFLELSERCRELEQNCANKEEASHPFAKAEAAAAQARSKVAQLIAEL